MLYSGFLAVAAVLVGSFVRNWTKGYAWRWALPLGYELSLLGVGIFMVGGVGDMLWHSLFGIEVNIEVLLSPTHLLLGFGGALIVSGPLRAAWARSDAANQGWASWLPTLLSLTLLRSVLSIFTAFASPLAEAQVAQGSPPAIEELLLLGPSLGVAGILVQTGLTMGLVLLALRRWTLPFGSLTLMFSLSCVSGGRPSSRLSIGTIRDLVGACGRSVAAVVETVDASNQWC